MGMKNQSDMNRIRDAIDDIDEQIIKLLSDRTKCVDEIAKHKQKLKSFQDSKREKQILARNKKLAKKLGVSNKLIEAIYKLMFSHFVKKHTNPWFVYMVRCSDDSLYTGITKNLDARIETHNIGKGAKYTRAHLPVKLVWSEPIRSESEAKSREAQIKKMTRSEKEAML